ncbi:MAG: 50S ribosomal protein L6 [Firmicutes bacterium]|uniref:Large ribosomal subunit protein uL6 n=1 Tax=Melghirimyces thermohalophilus TaxID=1236220 RepID=A0A1G6PE20_9BACL|nr:50S ribosomal protein L6 [Melghirimyces thermohalophilus]MDA8352750.1 50S ribosomal protein L6 [Bacillota bacterium]SDC78500.1 LSU ribosomal protein L6P [Melghirimyces thermohalophilus]
MSRIGRKPIAIPNGVEVNVNDGEVSVKGPKGTLSRKLTSEIKVNVGENEVVVERPSDYRKHRAMHGTVRSLVANMIEGVTNGYTKTLELSGVGYRAQKKGEKVVLNVGYSHPVEVDPIDGVELDVPSQTQIVVKGIDKERVGAQAAKIRSVREPEPYKGKGIKYADERIRRKEGKTGK